MIDTKAFHSLSYGFYIIGARETDGRAVGCVVNTFAQVTSTPAQVSVAINKDNHTCKVVQETGLFTAAVLDESASMELIGAFGFHSSADTDKFDGVAFETDAENVPYVTQSVCARFSVRVVNSIDLGSHILFIGEVYEAQPLPGEASMTYAFYHAVKGGKTPPKASSFDPNEAAPEKKTASGFAWRCTVCGHIEYVDELPDDYVCPVCGVGKELFERIEL